MQYENEPTDHQRMPRRTECEVSIGHPPFVPVVIIVDDLPYHTEDKPFCPDWACICHEENQEAIARVAQWVEDGLITPQEATQYILGRTH